jgi:exodeoxyribonuclease VII small subunit
MQEEIIGGKILRQRRDGWRSAEMRCGPPALATARRFHYDCGGPPATAEKSLPVPNPHSDVAAMPFEKAMQELEDIVGKLEKAAVPLEDSVKLYERGNALKKRCEQLLAAAEAKIEKITLSAEGAPTGTAPFDAE